MFSNDTKYAAPKSGEGGASNRVQVAPGVSLACTGVTWSRYCSLRLEVGSPADPPHRRAVNSNRVEYVREESELDSHGDRLILIFGLHAHPVFTPCPHIPWSLATSLIRTRQAAHAQQWGEVYEVLWSVFTRQTRRLIQNKRSVGLQLPPPNYCKASSMMKRR